MRREVISTTTVAGAILLALALLAALLLGARAQPAEAQTAPGNQFAPDSIIVKLETGAASGALQSTNDRIGARAEKKIAPNLEPRLREIKLPAGLSVGAALARYRALPNVQYAEPNYLRFADLSPTDTYYTNGSLWGLNNSNDADIDAPEAWDTATGNSGSIVAVIDSGVNYNHPDLTGNNWTNTAEANGVTGTDDDANGYIDDVRGWDYVNNDADPNDDNSHGTHVAGTIGAKANNGGVVGVNHQVRIMPLKFLSSSGSGNTANAIRAVDYASANGAMISNNSWGGGGFSQGLLDAINRANTAGQLFVAAAGNGGADGVGDNNNVTPHYPSSYDAPNIVAVAATDRNDSLASYSNYGATSVDLAAPGSSIVSTVLGSNYGTKSGTSMATPHVAGVAALLKSEESALTPAQIKDLLLQNVDTQATHPNLSGVSGKMVSGGRLNAAEALAELTPPPPDTTAPSVSGVTPTDQASGVAINAPVTATFDEPMDEALLNTAFTLTKQGTTENVGTSVTYDAANNKATLNHPDLEPGITYTATVKGGADGAKDAAGNALAADRVWSFTTAPPDTTAPTVSSFTPTPDRVTGVVRGTNVTAKFSEAMNPATANTTTFMLFKGTTSAPPSSYTTPIASGTTVTLLSTDGLTATLNPYGSSSTNLARGTWYTAVVKGGAADCTSCAKDKAGNPLAVDKVWSFKTKS